MFHEAFSHNIKRAILDNVYYAERFCELLRFSTQRTEKTTLSEYVSRMKEGQESIYYLADDIYVIKNLSTIKSLDVELILISDEVDEYILSEVCWISNNL